MVRQMLRRILPLLLLALLLLPGTALANSDQVIDNASIFTAEEEREMEEIISRIENSYQVDIVVLTADDVPYGRTVSYADDWYDEGNYGMGVDDSGMLYLIDMRNRQRHISTAGMMIDLIDDEREEALFDAGEYAMRNGQYGASTIALLKRTEKFLLEGRREGQFRYDESTGRRTSGFYNRLTSAELIVAAVAGVAVALIFALTVKAQYALKGQTYAYDMEHNVTCAFTKDESKFLHQHITRRARPQNNGGGSHGGGHFGGGSGTHVSSGGVTHGGGSRGF